MLSTTSKRKRDGKDHGEGARRGARKKFKTSSLDKSKAHKYNRMESMHDGLIETALASTNQVQKKNMTEKDVSKARGLARFEAKQRRREKKLAKERPSEEDTWSVSHAIGGSLLSLEPVFSADEKYAVQPPPAASVLIDSRTDISCWHISLAFRYIQHQHPFYFAR
jgi:hypothetical protein